MFVSHIQGTGMSPHGAEPALQDSQSLQRGRPPWATQRTSSCPGCAGCPCGHLPELLQEEATYSDFSSVKDIYSIMCYEECTH